MRIRQLGITAFVFLLVFFAAPWRQAPLVYAQAKVTLEQRALSNAVTLMPPTPLPQSSCISQAPAGTHGITTCWVASVSTTATGYNVYVGTVSGGPYTKQNTALVSGTSFFYATPNLGGVKQFIGIRTFDGTAESANSTEVTVTALGNPLAPTGVQAVAASVRWQTEPNL